MKKINKMSTAANNEEKLYGLSDWVFETLMEMFTNALKGGTDED